MGVGDMMPLTPPPSTTHTHTHNTHMLRDMGNFVFQLGLAVGCPRYLVKHYLGCLCEGRFAGDEHLDQWILNKADCPALPAS